MSFPYSEILSKKISLSLKFTGFEHKNRIIYLRIVFIINIEILGNEILKILRFWEVKLRL